MKKTINDNNEIGRLIMLARGDRSLRQYANDSGVGFTTIHKIENGEYKLSSNMIHRLTSPEAKPQNGITCEQVMTAAGFKTSIDDDAVTEAAHEIAEQMVDESIKEGCIKKEVLTPNNRESFRAKRRVILTNMAKGIIFTAVSQRRLVFTCLQEDDDRPWRNDSVLLLAIDKGKIQRWRFDFAGISIYPDDAFYRVSDRMILGRVLSSSVDEGMKYSIVTNSTSTFSRLASREHMIPYRGELSVILVDLDEMVVVKEVYISNYYENDQSSEFYLV